MVCSGNVTRGGIDTCQVLYLFIHSLNFFIISLSVLVAVVIRKFLVNFCYGNEMSSGHSINLMRIINNKLDANLIWKLIMLTFKCTL